MEISNEGSWENQNKEGFGKMKYSNGDFYEGLWHNDLKQKR